MNEAPTTTPPPAPLQTFGRYVLYPAIARGGMATVHTARLRGADGFSRLVAVKRLHPQLRHDPDFVAMFRDEARIASVIRHPNVVPVLDVVVAGEEMLLVQEYVHGVPLSQLIRAALAQREPVPMPIVIALVTAVLSGLHAVHEAKDELGEPLHIVHRDVSPQNVMISVEGVPRLLDFGVAKARTSGHQTGEGFRKGKLTYMAPEQHGSDPVTRVADVYATGVVLWELLVNSRFRGDLDDVAFFSMLTHGGAPTITGALADERESMATLRWEILVALAPIVTRALSVNPADRFQTALEMREAILGVCQPATPTEVADWVKTEGAEFLARRDKALAANEESWRRISATLAPRPSPGPALTRPTPRSSLVPMEDARTTTSIPMSLSVERQKDPMRVTRALPVLLACAVLLLSAALVQLRRQGSTLSQAHAPREPAAAPAPIVSVPVSVREMPVAQAEAPSTRASSPVAQSATIERPRAVAPPFRPTWAIAKASAPPRAAAEKGSGTASVPAAPSAAPDCATPFYFEGAKKIFKPGCL